jgi:hypothetical protein
LQQLADDTFSLRVVTVKQEVPPAVTAHCAQYNTANAVHRMADDVSIAKASAGQP